MIGNARPGSAFFGRERELAELEGAIDAAERGRGGLWLISGAPGMGKSRLVEVVAERARGRLRTVYGRAWEVGGAPAFWPWIEVIRELLAELAPGVIGQRLAPHLPWLVQLMPELGVSHGPVPPPPALEPERARFQLMAAAAAAVRAGVTDRPALIVLEDLHAADVETVLLLELLTRQVRTSTVLLLATHREVSASNVLGPQLARLGRGARSLKLAPLSRAAVERLVAHVLTFEPDATTVDAVHARGEGNPLFVYELARVLRERPDTDAASLSLPSGIVVAIRERLAHLPAETRRYLARAAVIGREPGEETLAVLTADDAAPGASRVLAPALTSGVIERPVPGRLRFAHALFGEVLQDELAPDERATLHRRLAEWLARGRGDDERAVNWSEVAHHYSRAGPAAAVEAQRAGERAADQALERHAYGEAARHLGLALDLLAQRPGADYTASCDLQLRYADALIRAGRKNEGLAVCRDVAELARSNEDAARLAQAALRHTAVVRYGEIDSYRVALLREALSMLPAADSGLRAITQACYAAALQPAPDPSGPIAMAIEAIDMARRVGDPQCLMATLRAGGGALMDLELPRLREPYNRELVTVARRTRDLVAELRGHLRLALDRLEQADITEMDQHVAAAEQLGHRLQHPSYRWPAIGLRGMRAAMYGHFDEAEGCLAQLRELHDEADDPNLEAAYWFQDLGLGLLMDDPERVSAVVDANPLTNRPLSMSFIRVFELGCLARVGCFDVETCGDEARAIVRRSSTSRDPSMLVNAAELAHALGDPGLASELVSALERCRGQVVTWGLIGKFCDLPADAFLGLIASLSGDRAAMERHYGAATEILERLGAHSLLKLLARQRRRAEATMGPPSSEAEPERPPADIALQRDGDGWRVRHGASDFLLKDAKGLQALAVLLAEPGREFHCVDLAGGVDTGDAGPLLDAQARMAYAARIRALESELAEAEAWNDTSRVERARAELDALSQEVARAVGLGGKERRAHAASERARINVRRRITHALQRIERHDAALARHLRRSVRTGTYCVYDPDA